MKKVMGIVLALCGMLVSNVYADDAARRKMAEELLLTMKVDTELAATYDRIKAAQQEQMQSLGAPQDSAAVEMQNKMMDMMAQEMSWAKLKSEYIAVYAELFSEEDLRALVDFYRTPVGQRFIDKQSELTDKMMQIGQKHVMELMPKMKAMSDEAQSKMAPAAPDAAPAPAQ